MIGRRLGAVVGHAALLCDHGVGASGQHQITPQSLFLPGDRGLVAHQVAAGDVDVEGERPLVIRDVTARVAGHEDARRDANGIKPAVGQRDAIEHGPNASPVGDVCRETDGRTATADARAGNTDALSELGDDFIGGGLRRGLVEVDTDDLSAFFANSQRSLSTDAGAGSDDDNHLASQFLFGRHTAQLGFFEQPILNVEGLLLG